MKKIIVLSISTFLVFSACIAQEVTPKEKAADLAKNVFSKSKHLRKEKYGVVKEKSVVIESVLVIKENVEDYSGSYGSEGLGYKIDIQVLDNKTINATLQLPGKSPMELKNVVLKDAYFKATARTEEGKEEIWEGAFISKNDNGITDFGLGIKPPETIVQNGLHIDKLFLKKL